MTATDIFSPEIRQEIIETLQFAERHLKETTGISFIASAKIVKNEEPYTEEDKANDIIKKVCEELKLHSDGIKTHNRKGEKVDGRRIAIKLIKEFTTLEKKEIGAIFNGRDRTTVINALQTHDDLYQYDKAYMANFDKCRELVSAMSFAKTKELEKITITLKDLQ